MVALLFCAGGVPSAPCGLAARLARCVPCGPRLVTRGPCDRASESCGWQLASDKSLPGLRYHSRLGPENALILTTLLCWRRRFGRTKLLRRRHRPAPAAAAEDGEARRNRSVGAQASAVHGSGQGRLSSGDVSDACFYSLVEKPVTLNDRFRDRVGLKCWCRFKDDICCVVSGDTPMWDFMSTLRSYSRFFKLKAESVCTL